jgi:hypothetical protein
VIEKKPVVRGGEAVVLRVIAERRAEKEDVVSAINAVGEERFAGEEKGK